MGWPKWECPIDPKRWVTVRTSTKMTANLQNQPNEVVSGVLLLICLSEV